MTYARTNLRVATAALLVALASCANNGSDPAPPVTSTATPSASTPTATEPSSTPAVAPSETEVASEAASVVLREYFATIDQLQRKPNSPIDELKTVAISTQLAALQRLIESQRSDGLRQTGATMIAELTVQSVNLDNSDPASGRVPTVQIDVCYDVSDVDILGKDGESVVSPDRPDTGWVRYSVSNYRWKAKPADGWRVASGADLKQAACSPA